MDHATVPYRTSILLSSLSQLLLLSLHEFLRNAAYGLLRREQQRPELCHKLRRLGLQKPRQRQLHLPWIGRPIVFTLQHAIDVLYDDIVLESKQFPNLFGNPRSHHFELYLGHVYLLVKVRRELTFVFELLEQSLLLVPVSPILRRRHTSVARPRHGLPPLSLLFSFSLLCESLVESEEDRNRTSFASLESVSLSTLR